MYDIKSLDRDEMRDLITGLGEPAYRAGQIFKWVIGGAEDFTDMTDLPASLREKLSARFKLYRPVLADKQISADGTVKMLWKLHDGNTIESVVMQYKHGNTVCISTQVGCRMGCIFCASTRGGLVRNLLPSEMLDQVRYSSIETGCKISNIVLMGIGEPLDNFDNVIRFLALVNDPEGLCIGMRHISLSTCGPAGGIERLMELDMQLTLSVSLHAPDDEKRSLIMPINKKNSVKKLIDSCNKYFDRTGRRVSYEYLMADGINDTEGDGKKLAKLLLGAGHNRTNGGSCHVNLIRLNRIEGSPFQPSAHGRVAEFAKILESSGITTTVRRRMGADIDAACGQLRRRKTSERGDGG